MRKDTRDLIIAVKRNKCNSVKKSVITYLSEVTCSPVENYTNEELFSILKSAFLDYLSTAVNPALDMYNFFDCQQRLLSIGAVTIQEVEINCILAVFQLARVNDKNGNFTNGFWG